MSDNVLSMAGRVDLKRKMEAEAKQRIAEIEGKKPVSMDSFIALNNKVANLEQMIIALSDRIKMANTTSVIADGMYGAMDRRAVL